MIPLLWKHGTRYMGGYRDGYTIHRTPDTAASFMLLLGGKTMISGELSLYEFKPKENTYELSLVRWKDSIYN